MKIPTSLTALLAALTMVVASAAAEAKHNAQGLVTAARAGIARISSGGFDTSRRSQLPLLGALRDTSHSLTDIGSGLTRRDHSYFAALSSARRDVEKLKVTFEKSGIQSREVIEGVKTAANAIEVLHKNFGREAARLKKGGQLGNEEKQRFTRLKKQREEIVSKLGALRDASKEDSGSAKLVHDLDDLIGDASRAAAADATAASYVDLLLLVDPLEGEWRGLSLYAPPAVKQDWVALDDAFSRMDALYREAVDADTETDWKLMERAIEVPPEFEIGSTDLSPSEIEERLRKIEIMASSGTPDAEIGDFWDADEEILESDMMALAGSAPDMSRFGERKEG